MKHSSARNVIERYFCDIKNRWAILRSPSYYLIKTQNRIILACCLLHNFIKREMLDDIPTSYSESDSDGDNDSDGQENENFGGSRRSIEPVEK